MVTLLSVSSFTLTPLEVLNITDRVEMERPQPNRSHDQGKRLNIHYQYSDHDLRSDGIEWRTRYHHLQQKFKVSPHNQKIQHNKILCSDIVNTCPTMTTSCL